MEISAKGRSRHKDAEARKAIKADEMGGWNMGEWAAAVDTPSN